jgi:DNA-binding response OmpR family regulator
VEELGPAEAGIPLSAIGIEDPELGPAIGRAVAVAGDDDLGALTDHVATEPDPIAATKLQPERRRVGHGAGDWRGEGWRLEDDQAGFRSSAERGQATKTVGKPGRLLRGRRQVEDEQVDRPGGQQAATDRETLVEIGRVDDDQPLEPDTAGDRFDRVETAPGVDPGDDPACGLGLGRHPQRDRRPARRAGPAKGDTRRSGQAAGTEDRIEVREPGGHDPADVRLRSFFLGGCRREGERAADGSCRAPARLERREGRGHVRRTCHRTTDDRTNVRLRQDRRHGRLRRLCDVTGASRNTPYDAHTMAPILVVDDDAKIVRLVRTYLERDGFEVVTAATGPDALDAIERQRPALVVLDLMLPELDGRAVIRAVRSDDDAAATPILVLSARGTTLDRIAGLEDGADDYLPKPFSPSELVLRVKSILRRTERETSGATSPTGELIVHGDLVLDPERYEVTRAGVPITLTRVEFRLLQVLLEADGRVLTRDQLLDAIYGQDETEVMDRTIDVHVGRLRDKLGDDADQPRYVATVRGVGYRAAPRATAAATVGSGAP